MDERGPPWLTSLAAIASQKQLAFHLLRPDPGCPMQDELTPVSYGQPSSAPERPKVLSSLPFEETVAALRAAIQEEGLWVLHELDPQALLRRGGFSILPLRQILFFHPRFMARILAADPSAVAEAPLKVVIQAMPDGEVLVRCPEAVPAFRSYPALGALAVELEGICHRLVARIAR
jgi:uncharacterized protein (DUF302 family)